MPPPAHRRSSSTPSPDGTPVAPDPRLWYVPPALLRDREGSPVRVSSPVLEWTVIQLGEITSPIGRRLTPQERELVETIYGDSVDAARVRIVEAIIANAPTTLGNQIRVEPGFDLSSGEGKSILIHEMGHVWQYQTRGTRYITDSIVCQIAAAIATGTRNAAYFNYQLRRDSSIADFPAEEQAQIIEDYYDITVRYRDAREPPAWVVQRRNDLSIYERLIRQVRNRSPRSESVIYQESLMRDPVPRWDFPENERRLAPVMPWLRVDF